MRRVIVRRSSVHGKGVFAVRPLAAGERVLEYKGERTAWRDAVRRHRREGIDGHTFLFGLSDGRVIDGSRGGNSARWLNHACVPNCETIEDAGHIYIHTLRAIQAGEELFIEYLLSVDDPLNEDVRSQYACQCAAAGCRLPSLDAGACCVNTPAEKGGDHAVSKNGGALPPSTADVVRIDVGVVFNPDMLKMAL